MRRLPLVAVMLGFVLLAGCHDRREGVKSLLGDGVEQWGQKLPYDHWQFNFFYPVNLPALVTMVYLEDGDIRESIFRRLDPTEPSQSSVGTWSQRVGGFSANFNISKALPVRMTVCWDSVIDKKAYETEIWFSRETWQQMLTAYPDAYKPGKTYYRDNMIIGLAPGGTVRVWLEDNGDPVVLQHPARQFTLTGNEMLICKGVTKHPDGYVYYGKTLEFIKGKNYPYGNW
ncbi:DUF2931 family protein [Enterobacter sp. HSTU-ASh6]|uniref:DUF2931 family protein n=1 Tax=Enterobacter sp. HSTU-ASh6 TaxID=2678687 RepID=UPI00224F2B18|nr:DUF2931 family protein [Enterobacter sp. HSTU-ASh6]MCX4178129.1 DUF2931 family protein [Enterobacter sp. HSTU-ASh6]